VFLSRQIDGLSRSRAGQLLRSGKVQVNRDRPKAAARLKIGDRVDVTLADLPAQEPQSEQIPLEILYQDEAIVAVNKPSGMVVHPAKGHWQGTLAAGLIHRYGQLSAVGGSQRPGIVHRLDRDTSGVILVAKSNASHQHLAGQFERRTVRKTYLAIVAPPPDRDQDEIEQPIGPHPYQREKMAIRVGHPASRPAVTRYRVAERVGRFALVHAHPKTGRTHQIRVHLAHAGSPILCDKLYAGHDRITCEEIRRGIQVLPSTTAGRIGSSRSQTVEISGLADETVVLKRQALHAACIEFTHPLTDNPMRIEAPLPDDLDLALGCIGFRSIGLQSDHHGQ